MGFLNFLRNAAMGFGRIIRNVATTVGPYLWAGVRTVFNPAMLSQLVGIVGTGFGLATKIASGNIPGALMTGAALIGMGAKTAGNVSKLFKKELAAAKKAPAKGKKGALKLPASMMERARAGGAGGRYTAGVNIVE
jgi:hypothetical protein